MLATAPAQAQAGAPDAPPREQAAPQGPPARDARPAPSTRGALDKLFNLLKRAPDDTAAKLVEHRIWVQMAQSGSDTADLLMQRARAAIDAKEAALAVELLDHVIEIRPDFAEAWHRRATARYLVKDYPAAIYDLGAALQREPRHFGALVGLGMIFKDIGQEKQALAAFRQALAIHPHLDRVPTLIRELEPKVEGRDI